ncbi:hypothetical protein PRIEUP_LOCUS14835, partial [Pristimantis euphronides]
MLVTYSRVQENYGVRFDGCILCALLFVFGIHVTRLADYGECVSLIIYSIRCAMIICKFINSFFCNSLFLLLLWVFSFFCINRSEENEEKKNIKIQQDVGTLGEGTKLSALLLSLVNAENFVTLFQDLLFEEETLGTESESIEEKICRFKMASKELNKVQIVIDSLKIQALYQFRPPMNESRRVQDLVNKFEHTETYMELRRHMLNIVQKQLSTFTEKGMALKIWLSEAIEFQERLHSTTCNSHSDIQQLFTLLLGITKDSEVVKKRLAEYERLAQSLIGTLQEMSACSGIFHKTLEETSNQNKTRKWHDILTVSVTEEATQVTQRFSRFTQLNECYHAHLDGLK